MTMALPRFRAGGGRHRHRFHGWSGRGMATCSPRHRRCTAGWFRVCRLISRSSAFEADRVVGGDLVDFGGEKPADGRIDVGGGAGYGIGVDAAVRRCERRRPDRSRALGGQAQVRIPDRSFLRPGNDRQGVFNERLESAMMQGLKNHVRMAGVEPKLNARQAAGDVA